MSKYCKWFWLANCTRNFFILNTTSEISVYLTCLSHLLFEQSTFTKNHEHILFKYWLKTFCSLRSQYCERYWLANRTGKIFILNHTLEIRPFLTWNWTFFSNDPLLPQIMNILCKFGKKDRVPQGLNTANDLD